MTDVSSVSGSATKSSGTTSATAGSSTASAMNRLGADPDMFLKLLVAQLKYQDPSSPTDPSQFLSQTAQFTTVEKLNQLADLDQKVFDSSRQQVASSMIGRTVSFKDASGTARTGLVTGVSIGSSTPNLTVNGVTVSLDAVTSVAATSTGGSSTKTN